MAKSRLTQVLTEHLKTQSLRKASQEMGIPLSTLHSYLAGGSPGKIEYLVQIADYLGMTLDELVRDKKEPQKGDYQIIGQFSFASPLPRNAQKNECFQIIIKSKRDD